MNSEKSPLKDDSNKAKKSVSGWVIGTVVVIIFVGARQLHPGGIRGLIGDFFNENTSSPEIIEISNKLRNSIIPIGIAAICLKTYGENEQLKNAAHNYNERNKKKMEEIVDSAKAIGGVTKSKKARINRQAYQEAKKYIESDESPTQTCAAFSERLNSGEYDI